MMNKILTLLLHIGAHWSQSQSREVHYDLEINYFYGAPDGILKKILGFNHQFPGPTLRATKGDTLVVKVTNHIQDFQRTSIHFHGIEQFLTPFEDGPMMISQCEIPYNVTYTYRFPLRQSGTYWYHAHHRGQYTEGLWGPLIIDNTPEVHRYDGEFLMTLNEWYHLPSQELSAWYEDTSKSQGVIPLPDSFLINGIGYYPCDYAVKQNLPCKPNFNQTYRLFEVEKGKTYRFRVLNSATFFLYALTIDGHKLETIETDGVDTIRVAAVDRATISTGARTSFLVKMDGEPDIDQYWIRVWGDFGPYRVYPNINPYPEMLLSNPYVLAVLRYKSGSLDQMNNLPLPTLPLTNPNAEQGRPETHGNIFTKRRPKNMVTKSVRKPIAAVPQARALNLDPTILPIATPPFPSTLEEPNPVSLNHRDCFPIGGVTAPTQVNQRVHIMIPDLDDPKFIFKPGFNGITYSTSTLDKPALFKVLRGEVLPSSVNPIIINGFGDDYIVEVIISDYGLTGHPLHLHGHTFWVMGYGLANEGPFNETRDGSKLKSGLRRETMAVQPSSWLVFRFRANNPGVWLMHCHMNYHVEVALGLVFVEGAAIARKLFKITPEMKEFCSKSGFDWDNETITTPAPTKKYRCDFTKYPPKSIIDLFCRKTICLFQTLKNYISEWYYYLSEVALPIV